MLLFVVRHAKAVSRTLWDGSDLERPLDKRGQRQVPEIARRIAKRLPSTDSVDTVSLVSSPSLRCRQTLRTLADDLGLGIAEEPLLGDSESGAARPPAGRHDPETDAWLGRRGLAYVDRLLENPDGRVVVASTHGDLIPVMLELLFERDGVEPETSGNQKGSFWTLGFDGGRLVTVDYEPAP